MGSIKRNFFWNFLLTVSGYVFPFLTFPYVTRVLGASGLGFANYALSVVDYAVLFSTLGLSYIGCREISQNSNSKEKISEVFSDIVTLHVLMSLGILVVYIACIWLIPEMSAHKQIYAVGAIKIFMNIFLVEWLFEGLQDFRYITIRTIIVRLIYVLGIFVFVQSEEDYDTYFDISIAQVVLNGIINWKYANKFVSFRIRFCACLRYIVPVTSMGITALLLSFYSTFNVLYLGSVCSKDAVGYYTTATKLYGVLIAVIGAYNGVLVPYMNHLYGQGNLTKFKQTIEQSIPLICAVSLPVITIGAVFAREIILFLAGDGYERAILPFQIVMIQVVLVGISQIFENQILLSFKRYKEILICTVSSVSLAVFIMVAYVSRYAEIASAYAVAIPHILEVLLLYYYAKKCIDFRISFAVMGKSILACLPIVAICLGSLHFIYNGIIAMIMGCLVSLVYYIFVQYHFIKDEYFVRKVNRILTFID